MVSGGEAEHTAGCGAQLLVPVWWLGLIADTQVVGGLRRQQEPAQLGAHGGSPVELWPSPL